MVRHPFPLVPVTTKSFLCGNLVHLIAAIYVIKLLTREVGASFQ